MYPNLNLTYEQKANLQLLESNRVIVRIWTSGSNPLIQGHSVGHVSVEIPGSGLYLSLWPFQGEYDEDTDELIRPAAKGSEGSGIIKGISSEDLPSFTLKKDEKFEGRPPEVTLCFYTLSTAGMEDKYQEFAQKAGGQKWSLLGFRDTCSCASAAWEMLKAGEIRKIMSVVREAKASSAMGSHAGSAFSSNLFSKVSKQPPAYQGGSRGSSFYTAELFAAIVVTSPDYLSGVLKEAKALELKKNPLLKYLTYAGETVVGTPAVPSPQNNNNNLQL